MTKNNIITFPKTNIREGKLKDIAKELEIQMTKIKEQRELIVINAVGVEIMANGLVGYFVERGIWQ